MRDTRGSRLLLAGALVTALTLIAADHGGGSAGFLGGLRSAAGSVLGGTERAVGSVARPVTRFFEGGVRSTADTAQVTALQRELLRLRGQLSAAQLSQAQYQQLSGMLAVAGRGGYQVVAATVVGFGQGYSQTVTLDAGSADGIRPRQTVISASGLVGQVVSVSASTCTVLLMNAPTSVVGVALAPSGKIGWVTGEGPARTGNGLLKLQILDSSLVLRPGEQLVTVASVNDQPFVPGVPVGVIASVTDRAGSLTALAQVRPYADLSALDVVGIVIAPPRQDPGYSVLPQAPAGH